MSWYCIRSQPKHEHIAAAHLRSEAEIEVYLPRIRFRRPTKDGPVWFTEALFPNYLFARFDLAESLRQVMHTTAVSGVIHFGTQYPTVPDDVVEELRSRVSADQVHVIDDALQPGTPVLISGGNFNNFHAVITRVMPARDRVAVLLDFLGRQTPMELPTSAVVPQREARSSV